MRQAQVKVCTILAVLIVAAMVPALSQAADGDGQLLAHNVYFSLKDKSPAAKKKLVAA
jgi:hypothetical protein